MEHIKSMINKLWDPVVYKILTAYQHSDHSMKESTNQKIKTNEITSSIVDGFTRE